MDDLDAAYEHLFSSDAMDRILTVYCGPRISAINIEFQPGFLQPETLEERKHRTEILVNAMWTIERALLVMDDQLLRSGDDDVVH